VGVRHVGPHDINRRGRQSLLGDRERDLLILGADVGLRAVDEDRHRSGRRDVGPVRVVDCGLRRRGVARRSDETHQRENQSRMNAHDTEDGKPGLGDGA
jgi:hypothetical protein